MQANSIVRTDGQVHCQMVNDDIPVEICDTEQGVRECDGCTSPTRRCTVCGKKNGIKDADGRCSDCVNALGSGRSPLLHSFVGTSEEAIGTLLDHVRSVATQKVNQEIDDTAHAKRKYLCNFDASFTGKPAIVSDLPRLHTLLMEHGVERNGIWRVSAPVSILAHRAKLLPDEAKEVLIYLIKEKYLTGSAPWDEVILIKIEGIEKLKFSLERPRAEYRDPREGPRRQYKKQAKPALSASNADSATVHSLDPVVPLVTYAVLYTHLVERSHIVNTERVVGGAMPMLQIRFKLNVAQAREALDWMLAHQHIQKKDEWRTISLLSESVDSTEGVAKILSFGGFQQNQPTKAPVASPRPLAAPRSTSPSTSLPSHMSTDDVIAALEQVRANLAAEIVNINTIIAALKAR